MSVLYVRDESGKLVPIYTIKGKDGKTPYIQDGYWYIGDENTGVKADGTGVDKVTSVDTAWWGTDTPYAEETGIGWSDGFAFLDTNGQVISRGGIHQRVPIAPGENVTFTVDEGNQVVKINATGGGSGGADESMVGTWVFKDTPSFDEAVFNVPCSFDFTVAGQTYDSITLLDSNYGVSAYFIDYHGDSAVLTAYSSVPAVWLPGGWEKEEYKTIVINSEPGAEWFKQWLRANATKQGGSSGFEMPQIRFANFTEYKNEEDMTIYRFTVENLGGGTLQAGDKLQICCRRKCPGGKKKLRKMIEYEITEEDINQRFLKIEVDPIGDGAEKWLFRNDRKEGDTLSAMYFRLKRVTKYSDSDGRECDAIFSNVETVWKTYLIRYDEDYRYSLRIK